MYFRTKDKFIVIIVTSLIIIFLLFYPIQMVVIDNQTIFLSVFNLKVQDAGVFAAIAVGVVTVLSSSYFNIKTYKSTKLSSIPDNSASLLIDLEYIFNEYEIYTNNNEKDVFLLLLQVLTYWKEHQKVFRLLTPKFYKKFLKIWSTAKIIDQDSQIYEINSKYIINAIIIQLSDIVILNDDNSFSSFKPELITDDKNIELLEEKFIKFTINKNNFLEYINKISGLQTRNETRKMFLSLNNDLEKLFNELKREIDEYD